jgi:hypothetical protein
LYNQLLVFPQARQANETNRYDPHINPHTSYNLVYCEVAFMSEECATGMILNTFAILALFLCGLRLLLAVGVVGYLVNISVRRAWSRAPQCELEASDNRVSRVLLLAGTLLIVDILAWPSFYLLLQSYVSEWPGLRCVYGVTQIGRGTIGLSRYLPTLVFVLEIVKPLLVFVAGAWFVLHVVNRGTQTAGLTNRVLVAVALMACLSFADACAEIAYIVLPKKEVFPSAGCCTGIAAPGAGADRFLPKPLLGRDLGELLVAYYAMNAMLLLALYRLSPRPGAVASRVSLTALLTLAVCASVVCAVFVVDVVSPRVIGEPNHHCPYDLLESAPLSALACVVFALACFCVGWAWVVGCFTPRTETVVRDTLLVSRLCRYASFGFVVSFAIFWIELARTR